MDRERVVEVNDVPIRIKLNEANYMNILTKVQYGEKKAFVEERHAIQWIEETIVGPITKEVLEEERFKELDALDMMQNTGIIYNPQAIIETQILTTIGVYVFQVQQTGFSLNYPDGTSMDPDKKLHTIILALMVEHVSSYFIQYFR